MCQCVRDVNRFSGESPFCTHSVHIGTAYEKTDESSDKIKLKQLEVLTTITCVLKFHILTNDDGSDDLACKNSHDVCSVISVIKLSDAEMLNYFYYWWQFLNLLLS